MYKFISTKSKDQSLKSRVQRMQKSLLNSPWWPTTETGASGIKTNNRVKDLFMERQFKQKHLLKIISPYSK